MKPVRKAVLPVAGLGTRVLPGTKTTPKELLNVVDRPILSYIVEEGRKAGIEHFVFVTGRSKGAIEDYFDHQVELEMQLEAKGKLDILKQLRDELPKPGEMSFVRQMAPLGLGHAVWCARDIIGDEPFAVMLPDVIVDADPSALGQLIEVYDKVGGGNVIGVEEVPDSETHKSPAAPPPTPPRRAPRREGSASSGSTAAIRPHVAAVADRVEHVADKAVAADALDRALAEQGAERRIVQPRQLLQGRSLQVSRAWKAISLERLANLFHGQAARQSSQP
jgi:hypothetical protein